MIHIYAHLCTPQKIKDQWAWNLMIIFAWLWCRKTGPSVSDVSCLSLKRRNWQLYHFFDSPRAKKIKTYVCRYTTRHLYTFITYIYILYINMQKWYLDSFPKPRKFINFNSRPSWFRSLRVFSEWDVERQLEYSTMSTIGGKCYAWTVWSAWRCLAHGDCLERLFL